MSDTVRTQIELPRDVFELLKRRSEEQGITPTQQIVEVLTTYLKEETDPVFQADDPLLSVVPEMNSGLGDLSTDYSIHDIVQRIQRDRECDEHLT